MVTAGRLPGALAALVQKTFGRGGVGGILRVSKPGCFWELRVPGYRLLLGI